MIVKQYHINKNRYKLQKVLFSINGYIAQLQMHSNKVYVLPYFFHSTHNSHGRLNVVPLNIINKWGFTAKNIYESISIMYLNKSETNWCYMSWTGTSLFIYLFIYWFFHSIYFYRRKFWIVFILISNSQCF